MNATYSDTPSATPRTLRFSDNDTLLPSKIVTTETVEATFANAVMSLPDNYRTTDQVKKDASEYTKLLSKYHRLMDKLKRFDDDEFIPHAVRLKVELKASKSVTSGPHASDFSVEKSALEMLTSEYQSEVKKSMRKVAHWTLQEAKRDLCNFACNFAIDLIASRLIDDEHAESSDNVQLELIYSILNNLLKGCVTFRNVNLLSTGSTTATPSRMVVTSESLLPPMLFNLEFKFKSTPSTLTDDDVAKYATLLNSTSSDLRDIFIETLQADTRRIASNKKATEKAKLLARISTTNLVESTATDTEIILDNLTAETLDELIEKRIEKRLNDQAKKANQSSSSSSKKDKKDKKKKKNQTSTSTAKKATGAASSPASSKKKSRGGKQKAESASAATKKKGRNSKNTEGDNSKGSKKRNGDAREQDPKKRKGKNNNRN